MSQTELLAELCHEINSPLAAIRNALYLIACHSAESHPEIQQYLQIADEEAVTIAAVLRQARLEQMEKSGYRRAFSRAA